MKWLRRLFFKTEADREHIRLQLLPEQSYFLWLPQGESKPLKLPVFDVSYGGLGLSNKASNYSLKKGDVFNGSFHVGGAAQEVQSTIVRITADAIGTMFGVPISDFLNEQFSLEYTAYKLAPVVAKVPQLGTVKHLYYDWKNELVVHLQKDNHIEKFVLWFVGQYISWQSGETVKTGAISGEYEGPETRGDKADFVVLHSQVDSQFLQQAFRYIHQIPSLEQDLKSKLIEIIKLNSYKI